MQSSNSEPYVHGYSPVEQDRLVYQADVISPAIFSNLELSRSHHVLEIGSGVGAVTLQLLERYPHLCVTCLDRSQAQIGRARENIDEYFAGLETKGWDGKGNTQYRVIDFVVGDARDPRVLKNIFEKTRQPNGRDQNDDIGESQGNPDAIHVPPIDTVFLCWVLEHVAGPEKLLGALYETMPWNCSLMITEVWHDSLRVYPVLPDVHNYWQMTIDFQKSIHGDANVGILLGSLLTDVGFGKKSADSQLLNVAPENLDNRDADTAKEQILIRPGSLYCDKTDSRRRNQILEYWFDLMESPLSSMREEASKKGEDPLAILEQAWNKAQTQWALWMKSEDAIFSYTFIQACVLRPGCGIRFRV